MEQPIEPIIASSPSPWRNVRIIAYIVLALLLFLFSIDLMTSSLQHLRRNVTETILWATSNPFTGLFIGLVITAMLQSSSTTTAMVVALVASRALTLDSAIPIIMGANIGTTITATIVSLGFINKKKEFRRAVAAGTYHYFFNTLTVIVLFPLEYYYGFLSSLSQWITGLLFPLGSGAAATARPQGSLGFGFPSEWLFDTIGSPFLLAGIALCLLFASILIFRRLISDLLKAKSPEAFSRFFFRSPLKSFSWGLLTTAAIRSSTITTSVVVPIVAKKIVNLKQAAPFIMGANVGTTITAFIAAILQANATSAVSLAIAHILFNVIGVLLFMPIPVLRKLPLELSEGLGKLTIKYRLAGFVYILVAFFFLPFSLIYFNQGAVETLHLTYERTTTPGSEKYAVVYRMNTRSHTGEWSVYNGMDHGVDDEPLLIYPVSTRNATLFIGSQMFQFSRPGFCWDGEDELGKYQSCIESIMQRYTAAGRTFDSVYIYDRVYAALAETQTQRFVISAREKVVLERTISDSLGVRQRERLVAIEQD